MNKATVAIFSALLADYTMVTIIVPIINDLFKIDYGEIDESRVGYVYSIKGVSQLCTGLLIGKISDKIQLKTMNQLGLFVNLLASFIFIFGRKFLSYLAARTIHGIGSALIASSSFSLLANQYKTDKERGEIMSKAGSGIACGVLAGPVVGGLLYALGEKIGLGSNSRLVPFASCSLAYIFSIIFVHFFINSPYRNKKISNKDNEESSETIVNNKKKIKRNLSNWEILKYVPILALVYLSFAGNVLMCYIEPILPNYWMKLTKNNWDTFRSGILFAFSPLSYTIFLPFMGKHGYKIGRHNVILIGMIILSSIALIIIPSEKLIYSSALFLFIMGLGSGAVDASIQPMLAQNYDNLLKRKKSKKMKSSSQQILNASGSIEDTSTVDNNIELTVYANNEERIRIRDEDATERVEEEEKNSKTKESIKEKDDNGEEEEEEAHNKYTRVFSLGNMAMNIAFIIGPMISSLIVAWIHGEDPSVNRFKSSFFRCCLIFTAFGCLSSLIAIIPGLKKYRCVNNEENNEKNENN